MDALTVFLVCLAALVALGLTFFQYRFREKTKGPLGVFLLVTRFLALFGLLLLLVDPKISRDEQSLTKSRLVFLIDNSTSMGDFESDMADIVDQLGGHEGLKDFFEVDRYAFGTSLSEADSLSFSEPGTHITQALASLSNIYKGTNTAVILLTDGNQTFGQQYDFWKPADGLSVYPIALGDTTRYEDLRIGQLNTNKFAFLDNRFPVEAYVIYEGNGTARTTLSIAVDGKEAFRENVVLNGSDNVKRIQTTLEASAVGMRSLRIAVAPIQGERNTMNNTREALVEVVDEKTKVALITDLVHPDLGALVKSIESNEQRSVQIEGPDLDPGRLEEFDIFIVYQPDESFRAVFDHIRTQNAGSLVIAGTQTDWDFLNGVQQNVVVQSYDQTEEIAPVINAGFSLFDISDFTIDGFPPLEGTLGEIIIGQPHETLLEQRIRGVEVGQPLLALVTPAEGRHAILFGENIWKWRAQGYRNAQNFENFDGFMGKLMRYLSTVKPKDRLVVDYETVYEGSGDAKITADYFDETFLPIEDAELLLRLSEDSTGGQRELPFLPRDGGYMVDLGALNPGKYAFTVTIKDAAPTKSGSFMILDYDVEQQFLFTNYRSLEQLALNSNGEFYFPGQTDSLIASLMGDTRFLPTQKSHRNVVSLIDFRIMLPLIALALGGEWLVRKYNGLI